jgi:hypothetical protein
MNESTSGFRSPRIGTSHTKEILLVAALALCGTARADYQSTVLNQNPVGYWRLEETNQPPPQPVLATNLGSLGPNFDGGLRNGVIRGEPGALAGTTATSERFTNPEWDIFTVGSYVDVPYTPALNPSSPFTVEFWAKPTSAPPTSALNDAVFATVCSLDTQTNSNNGREGYVLYIDGAHSGWQFRMGNFDGYVAIATGGSFTSNGWSYVVGTFTGSALRLYVDGTEVAVTNFNGADFTPNTSAHFNIGMTTFPNRTFDGWIEEVAFYTNELDAATIKAHFDAATTNGAGYAAQILANNPIGYWRLGEPADPIANNLGSLGTNASGSYISPAEPGIPGPRAPAFSGFDPGNNAVGLPLSGSFVSIPALNLNTNTVSFTGWVKANGPQVSSASLLMSRWVGTQAGLTIDVAGGYGLSYTWNNDPSTFNWASGLSLPDSDWAFVALVVQASQAVLFVADDTNYQTFASATNVLNHANQAFDGPTLLGEDLAYLNRFFIGAIDEIAIFNRALSSGEVYSQYASAVGGVPPLIFSDPIGPTNELFIGDGFNLTVDAGGSPALAYQWHKDGFVLTDATTSQYSKANVDTVDAGNYDVIVSNSFGSTTSLLAVVQVSSLAKPGISQDPIGRTLYPGGTLSLSVVAVGGILNYQWVKDAAPLPGATNSTYVVPSVTAADGGIYIVTVSNQLGTATSSPATVTVTVPAAGTFEASVVANGPEAWWRLDEAPGATSIADAMGRHDGILNGIANLGVPGALGTNGGTAVSFGGAGYASIPFSPTLNPPSLTLECWAKTKDLKTTMSPVSSHFLGKGCYFETAQPASGQWDAAYGSAGGQYFFPSLTGAATMESDAWTLLVLTFDPANLFRFYVNGQWDGRSFVDFDHNAAGPLIIGGRGLSSSIPADLLWKGQVDEVMFYAKALSLADIQAHYAAALYGSNTAPVFKAQPQTQVAQTGTTLSFRTLVEGSLPISLQWLKNNSPLLNETNSTLTLSNVTYADSGSYQVSATNLAGFAQSTAASLVVMPQPTFANLTNGLAAHLKFDNDFTDSSGHGNDAIPHGSPQFVAGHLGSGSIQLTTLSAGSNYSYISLPDSRLLEFSETNSLSVSFWVNYTNTPDDLPMIGNAVGSILQEGWAFADHNGQLAWTLVDTNGSSVLANPAGGPAINDGNWHNVVASFDRETGIADTYIDGSLVTSRSWAGLGDLDTRQLICLGQDPTGKYAVDGVFQMDDLGIWQRSLTIYDAQAIYQLGQAGGLSFDTYGPVTLVQIPLGHDLQLVWQAGILLEADSIEGPWTPVIGASPPAYVVSPGSGNKFYRIQL